MRSSDNENAEAAEIIERMKVAAEVSSDAELARFLKISKSTLSSWRQRGSVPYAKCVQIAFECHVSLDWLIAGHDEGTSYPGIYEGNIDVDLMAAFIFKEIIDPSFQDVKSPWDRARYISKDLIRNYNRYSHMLENEVTKHGVSKKVFIENLRNAFAVMYDEDKKK